MQRYSKRKEGWLPVICALLLLLLSNTVQAQSTIVITPNSGPPGTTVFITNNNAQARAQCFANQQTTTVPAGGSATFVINDPVGSQVTIACSFGAQGGSSSIVFVVTSPDSDGDGVPDNVDQCPTEFAQTQTGCPSVVDSDGDGVPDPADQCPQQFAQTRNGCPDSDGDGVPDNLDQCPQEFAQTESGCPSPVTPLPPSPVPATLPPLPQLLTTGACQVATLDYNPVNVRQERSTESTILFRLDPFQIYTPTQFVEGWYFIEALGGWVRQDVVRTGGENCATLGGAPIAATLEPSPVPPASGLPSYVVPLNNDLSALFGACPNLAPQVGRLPIAQVLRLSISHDPCGGLQDLLREISFGGFPLLVPEQISQVMSSSAQCSTDPRPFPSPELLAFISALDQIDINLAMQLNLSIVSAVGSPPGSDGDNFLCALMRGDIFEASTVPGFLSFPTQTDALVFTGGLCVPPLEASEIRTSVDRLASALTVGAGSGIPTLDAFIQSLTDASIAFAERREIFCGALSVRPLSITIDTLTPEQRLSVDWLIGCGLVEESSVSEFISIVNRTESASGAGSASRTGVDFGTGFTWDQLQDFYASYAPGSCPSFADYLTFVERARGENGESPVIMETSLDLFGGYGLPPVGIGGVVYTVVCDTSGATADGPAPLGCRWSDETPPVPDEAALIRRLLGGLYDTPETPEPRFLQPNYMRDPFEPGIPGVEITISNGTCDSGGAPAVVVLTDATGRFFVEDLPAGSYCASISPAALGEGDWWAIGYSGGEAGPYRLDLVTSPVIGLFQQVGWRRAGVEEPVLFVPSLPSGLLLPDSIPTVPPLEGTPAPMPVSQRLSIVVYDDRCDNSAYDGLTLPSGCTNFYLDTLTADGVRAAEEPGIPGVQIDLIDGDCDGGTSLGFLTTDGAGLATLDALLIPGQDYCISVQADSSVNAPILVRGGWTTIAGPRFTYRIAAPALAREYNIEMPWWTLAPDVLSGSNPFLLPILPTDIPLTLLPIPTDLPFAIPTLTPIPHYNVPFLAVVWADVCNGAAWTGDFRTVPPGCAIVAPTTLDSNGIADDFESRLAGVQVSLMLGTCDSGASVEPFITTDGTGQAAGSVILAAGTYCVLIDPAAGPNPTALGTGQWRGALGTRALTQITIPYFQPTVELNYPWQPIGAIVTPAAPPPIPPTPPPGVIPPAPAHGGPICPAGCTAPPLPPPPVPPLPTLPGTPTTLGQLKSLGSASGINWRNFRGQLDGLGAFLGENVIDPSALEGLYLYDSGEIFNLILGPGQDPVAASLSPDGSLLAYVSRDGSGRGTLFMMNVVNGFYTPIFTEPDGALLDGDAPLWSKDGKLLLFVLADVNADGTQTPNVYSIDLTVLNAVPELILRNLSNPTFSEDGELLAFVRDRNVYIQLSRDSIPRQLTNQPEGTSCDSPFFDTAGINLYFICRSGEEASLVIQGFDGLQPVSTGLTVVTSAELGPVDGILTIGDGRRVYIVGMDGMNLKPLIDLGDLDVDGFGWAE